MYWLEKFIIFYSEFDQVNKDIDAFNKNLEKINNNLHTIKLKIPKQSKIHFDEIIEQINNLDVKGQDYFMGFGSFTRKTYKQQELKREARDLITMPFNELITLIPGDYKMPYQVDKPSEDQPFELSYHFGLRNEDLRQLKNTCRKT